MSTRLKSLAGLTAVAAVLAVAGPAASADAATTTPIVDPTVCSLLNITMGPLGPTQGIGGASLADVLKGVATGVGCQAPATPTFPGLPALPFASFPYFGS